MSAVPEPPAVALTSLSHGAGCGCKLSAADIGPIVAALPAFDDPRLLVGSATSDDAGIVQVRDDLALVQSVDFFTPIVDDPYDFGRIAAANALSDIYAMGAEPLSALNLVAFPLETLGGAVLGEILRGGADVVRAAGALLVGGHSIDDPEPKYGLAVTGLVDPRLARDQRGRAGRRPARAHQAARGRRDLHRAQARAREGAARSGRGDDDHAQRGRVARGACRRRPRDDRRHGLRPAGAPARAGRGERSGRRGRRRRRAGARRRRGAPARRRRRLGRQSPQSRARRDVRDLRRRRRGVAAAPGVRRDDVGRPARRGRSRAGRGRAGGGRRAARGRPAREHQRDSWSGQGLVARPAFKAGEPRQSRGGKVRLLRRSVPFAGRAPARAAVRRSAGDRRRPGRARRPARRPAGRRRRRRRPRRRRPRAAAPDAAARPQRDRGDPAHQPRPRAARGGRAPCGLAARPATATSS